MKVSRRYKIEYKRKYSDIWFTYANLNGNTNPLEDDVYLERATKELPNKEVRIVSVVRIETADEPKEYPGGVESIIEDRLADWLYWGTIDFEQLVTLIAQEIKQDSQTTILIKDLLGALYDHHIGLSTSHSFNETWDRDDGLILKARQYLLE